MVNNLHIDAGELNRLAFNISEMNVRDAADDEFRSILENEFLEHLGNKIKQKGLVGEGPDKGEGPHLHEKDAWQVIRHKNMQYTIRTNPLVSERAVYLEYGTPNLIYAEDVTDSGHFKFESTEGPSSGEIIYPRVISGVDEYSYFREAVQEFQASDILADRVADEITEHIRKGISL